MMKNNVICIFVDSVSWTSTSTNRAKVSPTPFLDSLKKESITASKLYSHGPYTDAAKRSLFTGRNCLDDFGYYYRMNTSPISDFKLFHDAGYETFGFYYPFFMFGDNVKKYIDHSIYTAGFIFRSEWNSNFKIYSDKLKNEALSKTDIILLKNRMNLLFDVFESYLYEICTDELASKLYSKCIEEYDMSGALKRLKDEKSKYVQDPERYLMDFLEKGEVHPLWTIDTTRIDTIIKRDFLEEIVKENKSFFRRIILSNIFANIRSAPSIKRIMLATIRYLRTKDKNVLRFVKNYFHLLCQIQSMMKKWGNPHWQNDNSIHTILKAGMDVIKQRELGKDKPFYMNLNTDDPHSFLAMFAYDTQDRKEVNDEIRVLNEYSKQLGNSYKGSLLYLLSLRYVDYEVEKFCKELRRIGLWDTTTLMVLADHGSSYTYYPLHNQAVNCFDDECYHIPVLLRHPNLKGIEIKSYINSKDIYPTVCDLVGIPQSPYFKGHSMLDSSYERKPYVLTEYMGPGCPDMTSRRMWLSARDKRYLVAYKVGIYEDFESGELAEVYDLKNDPWAYYNINSKVDRGEIEYLLTPLRERYNEIKTDVTQFVEDITNEKIVIPIKSC